MGVGVVDGVNEGVAEKLAGDGDGDNEVHAVPTPFCATVISANEFVIRAKKTTSPSAVVTVSPAARYFHNSVFADPPVWL